MKNIVKELWLKFTYVNDYKDQMFRFKHQTFSPLIVCYGGATFLTEKEGGYRGILEGRFRFEEKKESKE